MGGGAWDDILALSACCDDGFVGPDEGFAEVCC